jgi:hypothetical protein
VAIIDVTPKLAPPLTYEVTGEKKAIDEYAGEFGTGLKEVVDGETRGETTGGSKRTIALYFMTGGLDVVQRKQVVNPSVRYSRTGFAHPRRQILGAWAFSIGDPLRHRHQIVANSVPTN